MVYSLWLQPKKTWIASDIVIVVKGLSKVFYWLPGYKRTTTQEEELVKFIGVPVKPVAILLLANKGIQSIINPQVEEQNI